MANQVNFRVVRITKDLQSAMASKREARGENNATVIANAVKDHLPKIIDTLRQLGFGTVGKTKVSRLPILEEVLAGLRLASRQVKVPASALLVLCLSQATETQRKATPKVLGTKTRRTAA